MKNIWWIVTVLLGVLLTSQCSNQPEPPTAEVSTPVVSDLSTDHTSNELLPGEEVEIWVNVAVVDPNIPIIYTWSIENGEIIKGQGTECITYRAFDVSGGCGVTLKVETENWQIERSLRFVVPTPTSTPTATNTPTPASTSTPTSTSTSTNTLTPTSTPTATPTQTPAPVDTPIPAPTPPQARVVAANGLELRSGPGADYGAIDTLPSGTPLDVLRRVVGTDDWIKVSVGPDSDDSIKGYVNTAPGSVKINVRVEDIPLMREFGPKLYEPKQFAHCAVDELITFKWQDYGPLEEHQYYSVILVRDDRSDEGACYHWQPKEPEVSFRPEDYDCTAGAYHWGVSIATDLSGGNKTKWRKDSEFNERNPIGIGMPYPNTPQEGTGGRITDLPTPPP